MAARWKPVMSLSLHFLSPNYILILETKAAAHNESPSKHSYIPSYGVMGLQ